MARDPRFDPQYGDTCTLPATPTRDVVRYRVTLRQGDHVDYGTGGMSLRDWSEALAERGGVYVAAVQHDDDLDAANRAADPLGAFYHGVFVTAMEGGVCYWGTVTGYKWRTTAVRTSDGETVYVDDLRGFSAKVYDDLEAEDAEASGSPVQPRTINRRVVMGRTMKSALAAKDAGEVDADVADAAVQMGLFGEVVYG